MPTRGEGTVSERVGAAVTMVIDSQQFEQVQLAVVRGSVDDAAAAQLSAALHPTLCQQGCDVLLDLSEATTLGSGTAAVLTELAAVARDAGSHLQVVGAKGAVLETLQTTGAAEPLGVQQSVYPYASRGRAQSGQDDPLPRALDHLAHLPHDSPTYRQLRDRVVTDLLPLANQIARRFHHRGEPGEDLTQVAVVALINVIDRYQPDRGDFFPFAVTTMTGELKRHLRDRSWAVRPPRRLQQLSLEVRWAETHLGQLLGRSPTAADIAGFLDVPEESVLEAVAAHQARRSTSLQAPVRSADVPLVDTLGDTDHRLDDIDSWVSLRGVIANLPERTRRILQMRFGSGMTQSQIARSVGVSQMHVSRILAATLHRLRQALLGEDERER
jgi:RNA polymerase sigma-B factor